MTLPSSLWQKSYAQDLELAPIATPEPAAIAPTLPPDPPTSIPPVLSSEITAPIPAPPPSSADPTVTTLTWTPLPALALAPDDPLASQLLDHTAIAQLPSDTEAPGTAPSLRPDAPEAEPFQPKFLPLRRRLQASPSVTLLVPSGYGKSWGSAAVGVGFQSRARFTDRADGSLGFGVGFGDARKLVGLDVGLIVFDITDFGRGALNFKLHRRLPEDVAIAAGVFNAINWGDVDGGISPYGVVTKRFQLQDSVQEPLSQLYVSLGAGSGRFRSELDVFNDVDSVGVFSSVALRVVEPMNFIAEWSGQDLSLGLSFVPFRNLPLVITPLVSDITGNAGDGVRFVLGVGYGISY